MTAWLLLLFCNTKPCKLFYKPKEIFSKLRFIKHSFCNAIVPPVISSVKRLSRYFAFVLQLIYRLCIRRQREDLASAACNKTELFTAKLRIPLLLSQATRVLPRRMEIKIANILMQKPRGVVIRASRVLCWKMCRDNKKRILYSTEAQATGEELFQNVSVNRDEKDNFNFFSSTSCRYIPERVIKLKELENFSPCYFSALHDN